MHAILMHCEFLYYLKFTKIYLIFLSLLIEKISMEIIIREIIRSCNFFPYVYHTMIYILHELLLNI